MIIRFQPGISTKEKNIFPVLMNKLPLQKDIRIINLNEEQLIKTRQQGIKTVFDTKFWKIKG